MLPIKQPRFFSDALGSSTTKRHHLKGIKTKRETNVFVDPVRKTESLLDFD